MELALLWPPGSQRVSTMEQHGLRARTPGCGEVVVAVPPLDADAEDGHRPDYPPKSPPLPKKPVEPPRPESAPTGPVLVRPRLSARIANRRAANWTLENAPWTPAKAGRYVVTKLTEWGYTLTGDREADITEVTVLLARAALTDGGQAHQPAHGRPEPPSPHPRPVPPERSRARRPRGRGPAARGDRARCRLLWDGHDREDGSRRRWALTDLGG